MDDLIIVCDCTDNAFTSRWPTLFSTEYLIYPDASVNDHEAGTKTLKKQLFSMTISLYFEYLRYNVGIYTPYNWRNGFDKTRSDI